MEVVLIIVLVVVAAVIGCYVAYKENESTKEFYRKMGVKEDEDYL